MTRHRLRAYGLAPGIYAPGPLNAITDVAGVRVGQVTLIAGDDIRTGVTAVLPHGGNIYRDRVPAGLAVGNGFGKLTGISQLQELGELETPLLLTNTLAVDRAAGAILTWTLAQKGNEAVRSINPVAGETNDGFLNNIRRRAITEEHALGALEMAAAGQRVDEGTVGAGTGTICFGWKGGIGTSSRRLPAELGGYTLGVLVQSNFSGQLQIMGVPCADIKAVGKEFPDPGGGSIMILIATNAPLADRALTRLAWRAFAGLARTGSDMAHGSGDYALAFSTAPQVRRTLVRRQKVTRIANLPDDLLSPLFQAVIEATEEAIYNSLFMATPLTGYMGRSVHALPVEALLKRFPAARRLAGP